MIPISPHDLKCFEGGWQVSKAALSSWFVLNCVNLNGPSVRAVSFYVVSFGSPASGLQSFYFLHLMKCYFLCYFGELVFKPGPILRIASPASSSSSQPPVFSVPGFLCQCRILPLFHVSSLTFGKFCARSALLAFLDFWIKFFQKNFCEDLDSSSISKWVFSKYAN